MASNSPPVQTETRPNGHAPRFRAAKACRLCHEKRVKCDASERGTPCTRCTQRGEPGCALIESRRGIYNRRARQPPSRANDRSPQVDKTQSTAEQEPHNELNPAPVLAAPEPEVANGRSALEHDTLSPATDASNSTAYREASWATIFNHVLEHRRERGHDLDKDSIVYVGEASPIGLMLKDQQQCSGRPLLHHTGPAYHNQTTGAPGLSHPPGMLPEELAFLEAKQAFVAPSSETTDALIGVFFENVFPLYPIVDPQELLLQHQEKRIPWMLLHAVCFISATYCPIRILYRAGFESRRAARFLFHSKAKALFDFGYEGNQVINLQVSILMSFWGGGPNNYWNFYTWICTGVTMAETLGFHRSMSGTGIKPQDQSLAKRIWWSLVVRDALCASLVGRPFRVNLDHCDVAPLMPEDFQYNVTPPLNLPTNSCSQLSGLYQIHATKLSLLLRRIITARFYPHSQTNFSSSALQKMLTDWRSELPTALQWSEAGDNPTNVFTSTLCVLYHHNVILAHVSPGPILGHIARTSPQLLLGDEVVNRSAQQIASASCSVVTTSDDQLPPHELFHGLFIASVVFYLLTRSNSSANTSLGISGLTNCKMVLYANRETWDAGPWIMQLVDKALYIPATKATEYVDSDNIIPNIARDIDDIAATETMGAFSGNYEEWPNQLFLGNLFDFSSNTAPFTFTMNTPNDRTGQSSL